MIKFRTERFGAFVWSGFSGAVLLSFIPLCTTITGVIVTGLISMSLLIFSLHSFANR